MSSLTSVAAKAALIAVVGVTVTVIATVTIVVLYCCSRHRKTRVSSKEQNQSPSLEPQTRRPLTTTSSTATQSSSTPDQSQSSSMGTQDEARFEIPPINFSQLTVSSLATLESQLQDSQETAVQFRSRPGRGSDVDSELDVSQKTWSAYETLPRGLTSFGGDGNGIDRILYRDTHQHNASTNDVQNTQEDIDTLDNDAYSTIAEIKSIQRDGERVESHTRDGVRPHPSTSSTRISTISATSSGSGYVINSLHGPQSPGYRERTSSNNSTGSDGYVINTIYWKPTKLPCISEDSIEYMEIVH